jgi:hypothetical protein
MIRGVIDPFLNALIQGGLLDATTIIVSVVYAFVRWIPVKQKRRFVSGETGRQVIHGLPLFPLLLMLISGFGSDAALEALLHTHRVILGVAALAALFTILEQPPPSEL